MRRISILMVVIVLGVLQINAQVNRKLIPAAGSAPEINIAEHQSFTLANGLTVFVIENHKLPSVALQLLVDYDPVVERPNSGYVSLTGSMLRTGTKTKDKAQIDNEIDRIGASISTSETGLYASSLKKHVEKLFSLSAEIIIDAEFMQEEMDKTKEQMISAYQASKDEPASIASVVRRKLYYGERHPFAETATEASINSITLDMVKNFYSSCFRPNVSYLAIVGDINVKEAKKLTEKYFSKWQKKEVAKTEYRKPTPPLVTKVALVDRSNAVQSTISIGHPAALYPGSPDAIPAKVANTILGGGTFRLFDNLREKHGYTYGAYSSLESNKIIGSFNASANVRNEVTDSAITQFLYEMNRMSNELVGVEELTKVKNYLSGNFAISMENPQTIANFAINSARYKLPADYYKNYLKTLSAVSAEDVQKVAKKHILAEQSYIVIVGKAAEIAEKLKPFSVSGKIEYYDTDGNPIDPNATKVPEGVTVQSVLDKYIAAIGGKENLAKVKDRVVHTEGEMQGQTLANVTYMKAPDMFLSKIIIGEMEQSVVVKGGKGERKSPFGNVPLTSAEVEETIFLSDLTALTRLEQLGVKAVLSGAQTINNQQVYKVAYTLTKGSVLYDYFDANTGLKVRQERNIQAPNGTFTQITDLSNYQEISGVKYAFTMKQSINGRSIEVRTTSMDVNTDLADDIFK